MRQPLWSHFQVRDCRGLRSMRDGRVEDQQSGGGGHQNRQAGAGLASERLLERRVEAPGAEQARHQQNHAESIDNRRAVAKRLHKTDEQKGEWSMLGQISVGADRLRERGDAAVGDIDFRTHPIDDDIDREQGGEKPKRIAV